LHIKENKMTLPAWATWQLARTLLPYIAGALAVWLAYSWAWDRGRDHERARLMPQLEQCTANVRTLKDGLANQSAAIEQLRIDERKATEAGRKAAKAGDAVKARVAPLRPALDAVAATTGGDATPDAVRDVWEAL
jgi:hypothetical protein